MRRAILQQMGLSTYQAWKQFKLDGCNCLDGVVGFIYYDETVKFFDSFKSDILKTMEEAKNEFGYNSLYELYKTFKCADKDCTEYDFIECLSNAENEFATNVKNALVWFYVEYEMNDLCNHTIQDLYQMGELQGAIYDLLEEEYDVEIDYDRYENIYFVYNGVEYDDYMEIEDIPLDEELILELDV